MHTSAETRGQIYLPALNWLLMSATIAVVIGFSSSASLAAAFGLAVSTTMAITTILFANLAWSRWHWSAWRVAAVAGTFLVVDVAFVCANALKFADGGWLPLLLGLGVFLLMGAWRYGRMRLVAARHGTGVLLEDFAANVLAHPPHRVEGMAVFLSERGPEVPTVLLHHLKHNQVLHAKVMLLSLETAETPRVKAGDRLTLQTYGQGFYRLVARHGFMESPNVPELLEQAAATCGGPPYDHMQTSFYLGRESLTLPGGWHLVSAVLLRLFIWLRRNELDATSHFGIPANRVVEMGARLELQSR